jgi:hypothetical protein
MDYSRVALSKERVLSWRSDFGCAVRRGKAILICPGCDEEAPKETAGWSIRCWPAAATLLCSALVSLFFTTGATPKSASPNLKRAQEVQPVDR